MKKNNIEIRVNRGITLLLVLALMTIFSILVITFMIVTTAAKNMSIAQAKALLDPKDREADSLQDDSDKAIEKILCGDYDGGIGALSILENLYGNGATYGTITSIIVSPTSNKLRRISCNPINQLQRLGHVLTLSFDPSLSSLLPQQHRAIIDRYQNKSVLIKNFGTDAVGNYIYIDVEKFSDNDVSDFALLVDSNGNSIGNWKFMINSPAFSGTGEGFVQAPATVLTPALSALGIAGVPKVFLPNTSGYGDSCMMNPDYNAPDHLTWFLAWYDIKDDGTVGNIIPSFHRPQLLKYIDNLFISNSSALKDHPDVMRAATLRPLPIDHENFTGSNNVSFTGGNRAEESANFLMGNGEWDVDNDNNGTKDSIWIDAKLPRFEDRRQSTIKPVTVQPLIAVLIRDLDGLLNVNAHGNEKHTAANGFDAFPNPTTLKTEDGAYNFTPANNNFRGFGMGPAEVRLDRAIGDSLFTSLLSRRNISSSVSSDPASVDRSSYASSSSTGSELGRLYPDFWGFAPVTFEPMGNRFFDLSTYLSNLYQNNPYMTNVYSNKGNPFGIEQLEVFLRSQNDVDYGQFADELKSVFTTETDFRANRYLITTHSSNIPAMSRSGGYGYYDPTPLTPADVETRNFDSLLAKISTCSFGYHQNYQTIIKVLPPEILRGEKINLNKVTSMSLVEKSEFAHQIFMLMMVICYDRIQNGYGESAFKLSTTYEKERMVTRLAQWSVNLVDFIDADATMTPMIFDQAPFSYANYMQNGYKNELTTFLNGTTDIPANCTIVFGKEDNDLFITKTFATHNRNTANSNKGAADKCSISSCPHDKGYAKPLCDGAHDNDFDQIFKPEGSLFIELYRAGDPTRWRTNGEFYGANNELNLAKTNASGEPVWRIAIGEHAKNKPGDETTDTSKSIVKELETKGTRYTFQSQQWHSITGDVKFCGGITVKPERFIFFVDTPPTFAGSGVADSDLSKRSFVNVGSVEPNGTRKDPDVTLQPNNFLVIAPRVFTSFKSKEVDEKSTITPAEKFGVPNGSAETSIDVKTIAGTNTRVKTMIAAIKSDQLKDNAATPQYNWDVANGNLLTLGFRRSDPDQKEIDPTYRGIGTNISEPLPTTTNMTTANKYYQKPTFASVDGDDGNKYYKDSYPASTALNADDAFDKPTYAVDDDFVKGFGTIAGFRSIFLQRLTDPTRKYHPVNNPYITVDWSMVDLHVFTSEQVKDTPSTAESEFYAENGARLSPDVPTVPDAFAKDTKLYFNIREWGTTGARSDITTKRPNIRDRSFDTEKIDKAESLNNEMSKNFEPPNLPTSNTIKWGELSNNYEEKHTAGELLGTLHPAVDFVGIPKKGFLHFPWNDSPLANTFELMLVPATSASRFGFDCYDSGLNNSALSGASLGMDGNTRFKNPITNNTSPYLNFFAANTTSTGVPANDTSLDLVRLFEYVHVPSRFINTNQPLSAMREPGKINLNTMTAKSWIALGGTADEYAAIKELRNPVGGAVEFSQPFRSPHAVNMVPVQAMLRQPVNATLLGLPNLQPASGDNLYTSLHHLLRLSETTTTRSNVFAIWITTGYFKVDDSGKLCEEIGTNDGTVKRHRDFYIIDRSIPVGFQRGKKLNTNNVILLKKSLE
ncbi:MAG: hypothetical protein LBT09_09940 [Planctomycetaceae bacterium]|jgi:hypothetical protein|nr:hypothetical protein [Planctomycetaceae bacterium]